MNLAGFGCCIPTWHESQDLNSKKRWIERKQLERLPDKQHVSPLRPEHTKQDFYKVKNMAVSQIKKMESKNSIKNWLPEDQQESWCSLHGWRAECAIDWDDRVFGQYGKSKNAWELEIQHCSASPRFQMRGAKQKLNRKKTLCLQCWEKILVQRERVTDKTHPVKN